LRLIALSFFALAAYVVVQAVRDLVVGAHARQSEVGIVLAAVSLVAMVALAGAKRRTGERLGSPTLVADSAETLLCAYLSVILLAGLVLNATSGWWWADPLAAIGIAFLALREGREAWEESTNDRAEQG
jgi:divalent metal cation (Fe/Co/Zn/Cd) transporter